MKKESSTKFLKLCLADALLKMMETQNYDSINITAVCEQAGAALEIQAAYLLTDNSDVTIEVSPWISFDDKKVVKVFSVE